MQVWDALKTRRTIRHYKETPVSGELLGELLRAAMQAPSAADARPWQFVVLQDRAQLQQLGDAMVKCDMLKEAAAGLLICADPGREIIPGFWPQDCACAAMQVLLAAHARGLGACWVGLHPVPDRETAVREACALPEAVIPFALIALGWPNETLPAEDRFDEGRVHTNMWRT